ncbi:sugar transferase [Ruegeria marina]|uniref:Sugar transferase involved in LPS biosynthesis (Colanic, teichoic acid) n=1 Tax=Ruegeria marina TaxID=639004 RepID=A0A1G6T4X5_9RHOB|nr:sugar transferase [Ruegeria marina]SDD24003.1 Sugar transferase involved in LPS biosynthesis (colanic, teichoic acid) [Ruegeria marina]
MSDYTQKASLAGATSVGSVQFTTPLPATRSGRAPVNLNAPLGTEGGRGSRRGALYADLGKRALDVTLVLLSLPVAGVVVVFCALMLWREGGNPFYWQARLGRGGKQYHIVKLRTMVMDADARLAHLLDKNPALKAEWDATQKLKNDPRITPVGGFLRRTSLDELPQLWNVLKGEMSLVGPRPMMPEQLPLYGKAEAYFSLRPGITGLWQVSDRNNSRFDHRSKLDADYARNLSLMGDLALLIRTTTVVVRRTGH